MGEVDIRQFKEEFASRGQIPQGKLIYECDFVEGNAGDSDFDNWPDGWARLRGAGLPRYPTVELARGPSSEYGGLRIVPQGAAVAISSPKSPVNPGLDYQVTVWGKVSGKDRLNLEIHLEFFDSAGKNLADYVVVRTLGGNSPLHDSSGGSTFERGPPQRSASSGVGPARGNHLQAAFWENELAPTSRPTLIKHGTGFELLNRPDRLISPEPTYDRVSTAVCRASSGHDAREKEEDGNEVFASALADSRFTTAASQTSLRSPDNKPSGGSGESPGGMQDHQAWRFRAGPWTAPSRSVFAAVTIRVIPPSRMHVTGELFIEGVQICEWPGLRLSCPSQAHLFWSGEKVELEINLGVSGAEEPIIFATVTDGLGDFKFEGKIPLVAIAEETSTPPRDGGLLRSSSSSRLLLLGEISGAVCLRQLGAGGGGASVEETPAELRFGMRPSDLEPKKPEGSPAPERTPVRNYRGRWSLGDLPPGYYRVVATLWDQGKVLRIAETVIAVLAELPGETRQRGANTGDFGWAIDGEIPEEALRNFATLLMRGNTHWVRFRVPNPKNTFLNPRAGDDATIGLPLNKQVAIVGVLAPSLELGSRPREPNPSEGSKLRTSEKAALASQVGASQSAEQKQIDAAAFPERAGSDASSPSVPDNPWVLALSEALPFSGQRIVWWQLGVDDYPTWARLPDLAERLPKLQKEFAAHLPRAGLVIPWPNDRPLPGLSSTVAHGGRIRFLLPVEIPLDAAPIVPRNFAETRDLAKANEDRQPSLGTASEAIDGSIVEAVHERDSRRDGGTSSAATPGGNSREVFGTLGSRSLGTSGAGASAPHGASFVSSSTEPHEGITWGIIRLQEGGDRGLIEELRSLLLAVLASRTRGDEVTWLDLGSLEDGKVVTFHGLPGKLYVPWRTAACLLEGTKPIGPIPLPCDSPNYFFSRGDHTVGVIWADSYHPEDHLEEICVLGRVQLVDCWGGVETISAGGELRKVKVGPVPVFVVGVPAWLVRWQQAAQFIDSQLTCLWGERQAVGVRLANLFAEEVVGELRIEEPTGWVINPTKLPFRFGPGETTTLPVELTLPAGTKAGKFSTLWRIEFHRQNGPKEVITFRRNLEVVWPGISVRVTSRIDETGTLLVQMEAMNESRESVTVSWELFLPGRKRQRHLAARLMPGINRAEFRVPDCAGMQGLPLVLQLKEAKGRRILRLELRIGEQKSSPESVVQNVGFRGD